MEEFYEFFVEIKPLFHYFQRKRTKSIKRIDSFLYKQSNELRVAKHFFYYTPQKFVLFHKFSCTLQSPWGKCILQATQLQHNIRFFVTAWTFWQFQFLIFDEYISISKNLPQVWVNLLFLIIIIILVLYITQNYVQSFYIILGVHRVQEAPPIPPKIVRKFCCFGLINGKSRRKRPMNRKIGLV